LTYPTLSLIAYNTTRVMHLKRLNSLLYITERRHLLSQLCPTGVPHLELLSLMGFSLTAHTTPWTLVSHSDTDKKATFRYVPGRYVP